MHARKGDVQRYLCRRCGCRFSGLKQNRVPQLQVKKYVTFQPLKKLHSRPDFTQIPICHFGSATEKALDDSSFSICEDVSPHNDPVKSTVGKSINKFLCDSVKRRLCASEAKAAKNLVKVETRTEKRAAGATTLSDMEIKGKLVEYLWFLKGQGYTKSTVKTKMQTLKRLARLGVNLLDPESVRKVIAIHDEWGANYKRIIIYAYDNFTEMMGISWKPPICKAAGKLPFIPLEKEVDALIAGCSKKVATSLQLMKETGMRIGEV